MVKRKQRLRGGAEDSFKVLTYNILDYNLASNAVPRTMDKDNYVAIGNLVTPSMKKEFLKQISDAYMNFHSDTKIGSTYKEDRLFKRKLWAANIKDDTELTALKDSFSNLEHITFVQPNVFLLNGKEITNLKGLLDIVAQRNAKQTEVNRIYDSIIKYNLEVADWDIRGYKISETIKKENADIVFLQEYGSCHDKKFTNGGEIEPITLPDSLSRIYTCLFFLYPKNKTTDTVEKDGIAIYYKADKFRIESSRPQTPSSIEIDTTTDTANYTLLKCLDIHTKFSTNQIKKELRRAVGFVKFNHIASNKPLICINAHLMTDTRNSDGSLKKGEVIFVNEMIEEYTRDEKIKVSDAIVFGGDFNTVYNKTGRGYNDRDIFGNSFTGKFTTGLQDVFITLGKERSVSSVNNTRSEWIDYIFSKNLNVKTIEYEELRQGNGTVTYIPNSTHPSDHIPIGCVFEFPDIPGIPGIPVSNSVGGRRKHRTKRRKGNRKRRTMRS